MAVSRSEILVHISTEVQPITNLVRAVVLGTDDEIMWRGPWFGRYGPCPRRHLFSEHGPRMSRWRVGET